MIRPDRRRGQTNADPGSSARPRGRSFPPRARIQVSNVETHLGRQMAATLRVAYPAICDATIAT